MLTKVAETLIAVRPVEEVLQQVMDIVFEHMPADRGFLMLEDDAAAGKLVPMVVKHRTGAAARARITVSKTIADRVMHDRVSILTSDAMVDPRFGAGDSIRFHGIRSAMCAPLWNKDEVIGIIHVDSPMLTNCFTVNDLDLLTALANYAARGGRAGAAEPEDHRRGEEARAARPLPLAAGDQPDPGRRRHARRRARRARGARGQRAVRGHRRLHQHVRDDDARTRSRCC